MENLKIIDENKLPKSEKITFDNAYNSINNYIDKFNSTEIADTKNNEDGFLLDETSIFLEGELLFL